MSTSGPISEFRILGPLAVVRGGREIELGGAKQRALLAILLLRRGGVVSVDRLVDELWGESPPPGAAKTLQVYVSRLRRVLGDGLLVRRGSGYSLELGADAVDVERFERLVDQGRELLAGGNAAGAAQTLREALDLWRGPALGDLADEPFAQVEVARLEELRLAALEERIEAELALGRHGRLVAELEALVGAHPVRERLRAQLMLALYRCGRQADALATYRDGREVLVDEFGLEPGPALQELERAILNQDPALGAPVRLPRRLPSRRPALLVALGGLVLAAAAAAAALQLLHGGGTSTALVPATDSLAVVDARRNAVVGSIPLGAGPAAVTVGDGAVWVANAGDQTLARVDPVAKQVVDRIGLGRIPSQLAFGEGALWVASAIGHRGVVLRVEPAVAAVVASRTVRVGFGRGDDLFAPPTPSALAVGAGAIWANNLHSLLWRLATARGRVRTFGLGASHSVDGIATGEGAVWVASGADDRVLRLAPGSGRIVAEIPIAAAPQARAASPYGIAVGYGAVWVADALANAVSRIDPTLNAVTATIRVGSRPTRLAVGEGAVWVLNAGDGTVARIDPRRNAVVRTIRVGRHATGIAAGLGAVWVTVGGGPPRAATSSAAGRVRPLPLAGCSPLVHGAGVPDLLIVSDLPTFVGPGEPSLLVADMRAAIRLVLRQRSFRAGRYRIAYQACDYSRPNEGPAPDRCAANGRAYALDRSLIGVIGAYNSFCSAIELPTLNAAPGGPVPMVSPANTYVGLTHAGPATAADEPDRHYPTGTRNYVRLVVADDYQSAAVALFLKQLGRKRLYLLNDGEGTGYAGAVYAGRAARKLGLALAGSAVWNAGARSYRPLARRVARSGADAVLLSGCICSNGRKLVTDLRRVLPANATLIGTDNFTSIHGFSDARGAFDGLYVSTAGLPAAALPTRGRRFLAELAPGRPLDDVEASAAYAAQATEILLDAIARSNGTRASVISQLLATKVGNGIVGDVSFDANGDPAPAPIAIYRVDSHVPYKPHRGAQALVFDRVVQAPPSLVKQGGEG